TAILATALSCGHAASKAPSIDWLPVVSTPSLPCNCCTSSWGDHTVSSWLACTSKCCCKNATTSGWMARAIRMLGLRIVLEPNKCHHHKQRHQDADRPQHVAKEAGHGHAAIFCNRFDHQVGGITNV